MPQSPTTFSDLMGRDLVEDEQVRSSGLTTASFRLVFDFLKNIVSVILSSAIKSRMSVRSWETCCEEKHLFPRRSPAMRGSFLHGFMDILIHTRFSCKQIIDFKKMLKIGLSTVNGFRQVWTSAPWRHCFLGETKRKKLWGHFCNIGLVGWAIKKIVEQVETTALER